MEEGARCWGCNTPFAGASMVVVGGGDLFFGRENKLLSGVGWRGDMSAKELAFLRITFSLLFEDMILLLVLLGAGIFLAAIGCCCCCCGCGGCCFFTILTLFTSMVVVVEVGVCGGDGRI